MPRVTRARSPSLRRPTHIMDRGVTATRHHNATSTYGAVVTSPLLAWYMNRVIRQDGPSFQKWPHYLEPYERHLGRFRAQEKMTLLEIGIDDGGSLNMWRQYLGPRARIYGADIVSNTKRYKGDPFYGSPEAIFVGDQATDAFWTDVRRALPPGSIDVLIDDGGHTVEQQKRTLEEAWKLLAPGGVYVCEDVHGGSNLFVAHVVARYLRRPPPAHAPGHIAPRLPWGQLRDEVPTLNQFNHPQKDATPNEVQAYVSGVFFYPYMIVVEKLRVPRKQLTGHLWAGDRTTSWRNKPGARVGTSGQATAPPAGATRRASPAGASPVKVRSMSSFSGWG